jgi:hypothetical protein
MGLDMSHDAWHGAYSSFARFRDKLTIVAGLPVIKESGSPQAYVDVDWDRYTEANLMGEWGEKIPETTQGKRDPLLYLLIHSDCDGQLHPVHAKMVADRVEELLPELDGKDGGGHIGDYGDKARKLIAGFRAAAEANEPVDFH